MTDGEYISRQAVCDILEDIRDCISVDGYWAILERLKKLPSVKPQEPKTGHWIIKDGKEQGYDIAGIKTWYIQIMCDKCGFIKTAIEGHTGQYHYCPHCGAKMIKPQEISDCNLKMWEEIYAEEKRRGRSDKE